MRSVVGWKIGFVVFLCVTLCSCARHFYDVAWQGVVLDSETGLPIPFCELQTNCSFQSNMDRSESKIYKTQTDLFGSFTQIGRAHV